MSTPIDISSLSDSEVSRIRARENSAISPNSDLFFRIEKALLLGTYVEGDIEQLLKIAKELEESVKWYKEEVERVREEAEDQSSDFWNLEEQIEELETEVQDLRDERNDLKSRIDNALNSLNETSF